MPNYPEKEPRPWYQKARDLMEELRDVNRNVVPGKFNRTDPTDLNFLAGRYAETVADTETSRTLFIPEHVDAVDISVSGGTATVQLTYDTIPDVVAGAATWEDWESGEVSEATSIRLEKKPTALRCTSASGAITWIVKA